MFSMFRVWVLAVCVSWIWSGFAGEGAAEQSDVCVSVRVRLRPERRSLFILICSVSGLQTCLIGCKAPELRPVKILRVAAATGVIKQHRVHRELLSNRADRVGSLLVYGRIGTRLFSLAPFSTIFFHGVSNEVKGKTPIIHQNPRMKPSPTSVPL